MLVASASVQAQHSPSDESQPLALDQGQEQGDGYRMREGLKLKDQIGQFRDTGGRITFYPLGPRVSLTVLENLALERVYGELEKRGEQRKWSVSGVVTEYRGSNYLRITRAVLKPKALPTRESVRQSASAEGNGAANGNAGDAD